MSERTFRVVIVDDEPLARDSVRHLLAGDPEVVVAGESGGPDAVDVIRRANPDILFLDIQMPELDGFDVLTRLAPAPLPVVIFVTAFDRYALRAFDANAVDYLLKPFDDARFAKALARAKTLARPAGGNDRGSPTNDLARQLGELLASRDQRDRYAKRFMVRGRDRTVVVAVEELDWIEAADYYVTLHAAGKTHLMRQTMAELEEKLDPARFFRVHRSAIVNVERVREVHPLFRGDCLLVLADGTRLKLSRTRRAEFERLFDAPRPRD
jgi:two-component system LytT family response regulator